MANMDRSARAWLVAVSADHFWRVAHWYDFDDLLQDGQMVWWRVVNKYSRQSGRVRSRPHIMALFKRSFLNHIHRLSNRKTTNACEVGILDVNAEPHGGAQSPDEYAWDEWGAIGWARDLVEFEHLAVEAPPTLKDLLGAMLSGGPSAVWRSCSRIHGDGTRSTTNSKLCRLIGENPEKRDLATELYAFLKKA